MVKIISAKFYTSKLSYSRLLSVLSDIEVLTSELEDGGGIEAETALKEAEKTKNTLIENAYYNGYTWESKDMIRLKFDGEESRTTVPYDEVGLISSHTETMAFLKANKTSKYFMDARFDSFWEDYPDGVIAIEYLEM